MAALEQFGAAEANLAKLEQLWRELSEMIPTSISFGSTPEYEDRSRSFQALLEALPRIDGWKPTSVPMDLDDIAQNRLDAAELGEHHVSASIERAITQPAIELAEYRSRLNNKRRALIRPALVELIDEVDADLRSLRVEVGQDVEPGTLLKPLLWEPVREHMKQIDVLLGSSVARPERWSDMMRHMRFGYDYDLHDIEKLDWPQIKGELRKGLYGANDPIPVSVGDLSDLVASQPGGRISTQLAWQRLDDAGFERLIFALIGAAKGYENPEWLMQTRAPDRGRDLSVIRVLADDLSGTQRSRVVIQCKHWLSRSINAPEVAAAKDQMALWDKPPIDILIIATSGRFTADGVAWVEQHNAKGVSPKIEMWPESHLERLLASRPALIAEFGLR